jgi:hypothetical protein
VISGDSISLDVLASGLVTVPANLPPACQKLYGNVGGPNINLDTPDFYDFSKAIQHSVNTPGLIGYNLLEKKAEEFGKKDFTGTYLRITLGPDMGDSPGPPYVLEIWPAGHVSLSLICIRHVHPLTPFISTARFMTTETHTL